MEGSGNLTMKVVLETGRGGGLRAANCPECFPVSAGPASQGQDESTKGVGESTGLPQGLLVGNTLPFLLFPGRRDSRLKHGKEESWAQSGGVLFHRSRRGGRHRARQRLLLSMALSQDPCPGRASGPRSQGPAYEGPKCGPESEPTEVSLTP